MPVPFIVLGVVAIVAWLVFLLIELSKFLERRENAKHEIWAKLNNQTWAMDSYDSELKNLNRRLIALESKGKSK